MKTIEIKMRQSEYQVSIVENTTRQCRYIYSFIGINIEKMPLIIRLRYWPLCNTKSLLNYQIKLSNKNRKLAITNEV